MIDGLFQQTNYLAAKRLLDGTALRQEAILSNLANVETPHYKRLDVHSGFESELQQAIKGSNVQRLSEIQPSLAIDRAAVARRKDGNTVTLENEVVQLMKNSVEHSFETQMIQSSLARLRLGITGRS